MARIKGGVGAKKRHNRTLRDTREQDLSSIE
jgi:ribosomal protein L20